MIFYEQQIGFTENDHFDIDPHDEGYFVYTYLGNIDFSQAIERDGVSEYGIDFYDSIYLVSYHRCFGGDETGPDGEVVRMPKYIIESKQKEYWFTYGCFDFLSFQDLMMRLQACIQGRLSLSACPYLYDEENITGCWKTRSFLEMIGVDPNNPESRGYTLYTGPEDYSEKVGL